MSHSRPGYAVVNAAALGSAVHFSMQCCISQTNTGEHFRPWLSCRNLDRVCAREHLKLCCASLMFAVFTKKISSIWSNVMIDCMMIDLMLTQMSIEFLHFYTIQPNVNKVDHCTFGYWAPHTCRCAATEEQWTNIRFWGFTYDILRCFSWSHKFVMQL